MREIALLGLGEKTEVEVGASIKKRKAFQWEKGKKEAE